MTKIYQIANPMWLSDTFVFKERKELGTVYIKVNYKGNIEEIGVDIRKRMHFRDDVISKAKEASKTNKAKLNTIWDEYWWHVHNEAKRLTTILDNNELLKKGGEI